MKTLKYLFFALTLSLCFTCSTSDETPDTEPVNISISDLSVNEGQNYTVIAVQIQLDATADGPVSATISTTDGTAEAGKDYLPLTNQSVTFAVGETTKTVEVTIIGDYIYEDDEHFEVTIVSVSGPATIDNATARIDILNEDAVGVQQVLVTPTLDWTALTSLAAGSEPPYEVFNFGQPSNIPNAEFTSVGTVEDTIFFPPQTNAAGDTLLYLGIFFEPGFSWQEYVSLISEVIAPGDSVELDVRMPILNNEMDDLEFKYDLHVMIGTEQGRFGPYIIDPKIRIPNQ